MILAVRYIRYMVYVSSLEELVQSGDMTESKREEYDDVLDELWWAMSQPERVYVEKMIMTDQYKELLNAV